MTPSKPVIEIGHPGMKPVDMMIPPFFVSAECDKRCRAVLGDGTCQEPCNIKACGFDGGDCDMMIPSKPIDMLIPGLIVSAECDKRCLTGSYLGDGKCQEPCNTKGCGFDGGDCD